MARFDVFRARSGPATYLLDCQADLLSALNTRLVVPLMPPDQAPRPAARLNPVFSINGSDQVMVTQFAAAVPTSELGEHVVSLQAQHFAVIDALDMVISGF